MVRRGAVAIPGDFLVARDALGSTIATAIGGVEAEVTIPVLHKPEKTDPTPLVAPPGFEAFQEQRQSQPPAIREWGWVMRYKPTPVWGVRTLLISTSGDWQQVEAGFPTWYTISREWLCAAHEIPLALESGDDYAFAVTTELGVNGAHRMQKQLHHEHVEGPTRTEVEEAFLRAARGDRPPLQHRLLLAAWSALVVGEFRRAAIDAASAAEVAIAFVIREKLRAGGIAEAVSSALVKDLNGIERIHKLCRLLDGIGDEVSKNRVIHELAGARNDAAHNGASLTRERATKAYECARDLVRLATPLLFL